MELLCVPTVISSTDCHEVGHIHSARVSELIDPEVHAVRLLAIRARQAIVDLGLVEHARPDGFLDEFGLASGGRDPTTVDGLSSARRPA